MVQLSILGKNVKRKLRLGRREEGWQENALIMEDLPYHLCLEVFMSFILTSTSDITIFKKKWKQTYFLLLRLCFSPHIILLKTDSPVHLLDSFDSKRQTSHISCHVTFIFPSKINCLFHSIC